MRTDKSDVNEGISIEFRHFTKENEAVFINGLDEFYIYAKQFTQPDYPWIERVDFKNFSLEDYQSIKRIISEVPSKVNGFVRKSLAFLSDPISYLDHVWINDRELALRDLMSLINLLVMNEKV